MFFLLKNSQWLNKKSIYRKTVHVVRRYSFVANEKDSSHEQIYMRNVLRKTSGCALFEPAVDTNSLTLQKRSIKNNEIISRLISVVDQLQKHKPTDFTSLNGKLAYSLNNQCLENYKKWPINIQLYALDIWHFINGAKEIPIFEELLRNFLTTFEELKNGPSLQVMYYVAWSKRKFNSNEEMTVTNKLQAIVNELSLDEISIYCLALVKNDSQINSPSLVKSLYDCLMKNDLRNYDNIGVTGVIKAVRRFSTADHINDLKNLQNQLVPFAKQADLMALTHIIQLGCKQRVFNQDLIELILDRFLNRLDKLRIKDVERALLTISTCNYKNSAIQTQFLNNVQDHLLLSLNTKFSSSLIRCISYLSVCGIVNMKLIDWALDPRTHGKEIDNDEHALLVIDSYAKINMKNTYNGWKLPDQLCAKLMPKVAENEVAGQKSEFGNEIRDILNANGVHCIQCQIAPYIPFPDVFFVYNKRTNKAQILIEPNSNGRILQASDFHQNHNDLEAYAVLPCLQRQTVFNSNRYNGLFQFKIDQFRMLGFKTIVIKKSIWKLYPNAAAQQRYLALELCRNNVFLLNKCFYISFKSKRR